ncbi:hypothetical protein GBA52_014010 [Prunus armeniaca]|nr:hypothetical protein GBA52_014010 [Prunus armeniaca]
MVGTARNGRVRHAFSVVNGGQDLGPRRLRRVMRVRSVMEKCDTLTEYIKRLKLCIKWFQELEGSYLFEREKLQNSVEVSERQCNEMGILFKNKEEELNSIIAELRKVLLLYKRNLQKKNWIRW